MTKSSTDLHGNEQDKDWYLTAETGMEAEIKILGSRFIAYAFPARRTDDFMLRLADLKKLHYSATHHCYAYRLGAGYEVFRYSDDGEPGGTAGKRILGAIDRLSLTDTAVVVVRYFGGTKLGVGRLGQAYGKAAQEALLLLPVKKKFMMIAFRLLFDYDHTSTVHHLIETHGAEIIERVYDEFVRYSLTIRASKYTDFENAIREMLPHTVRISKVE